MSSGSEAPHRASPGERPRLPELTAALAVWTAAAVLGWVTLRRGWLPHDAGALGQAAERVRAGELPHVGFADTYTGGLAFLDALAFKVLGTSIASMRLAFFAAYLVWVPVFHAVATRLADRRSAAPATLLAAAITLPVYPEGLPSWYNLFLATGAVWALLRHEADGRGRWLALAGLAAGVSILFKIVGLYVLAGAGLYLLVYESRTAAAGTAPTAPHGDRPVHDDPGSGSDAPPDRAYRTVVLLGLALVAVAVARLVLRAKDASAFVYFGLPPLLALAAAGSVVGRPSGRPSRTRFAGLLRLVAPLVLGAAVPLALFLVPYLVHGGVGALWEGVFVLPQRRFQDAKWMAPPLSGLLAPLAVTAWVVAYPKIRPSGRRSALLLGGGVLLVAVALSGVEPVYRACWTLFASSGVVVTAVAAARVARRGTSHVTLALLVSVFAFHNLVQVPFAAPIYALYAFPLLLGLVLAAAWAGGTSRRRPVTVLVAAMALFALWRVDTGFLYHLGFRYRLHNQTETLDLPRAGGIRVSETEKSEYETLVRTVEGLNPGEYILALPDCPEVYFLTGRKNPTRLLFDFLDPRPEGRTRRVLDAVDRLGVRVVVVNRNPLFSDPPDPALLRGLEKRFPNAQEIGRFLVAWDASAGG